MIYFAKLFVFLTIANWFWVWTLISNIETPEMVIFIAAITSIMVWTSILLTCFQNKHEIEIYCFIGFWTAYAFGFICLLIVAINCGMHCSSSTLYLLVSFVSGLLCYFNVYVAKLTINDMELINVGKPNELLVYKPVRFVARS